MPKAGMKRPEFSHSKNDISPVPQIQGKAKHGNDKANPIIPETFGANQRVYHDKPVPQIYAAIDNDLARDNLENDLTAADSQDL